jgi:acetyltransferase-like isoleucine patch superfamily enzyme
MESAKFKVKDLSKSKMPRWQQYASLTLGKIDGLSLLKYELILLACNGLPGALGIYLRSKLYPSLLGEVGKNVIFGRNITLRHPHKIFIGDNVIIDDNCVLDAKGHDQSSIRLGEGVFIGRNSTIYCKNGSIEIGSRTNVGPNCQMFSARQLTIGQGTLIAAYTYIMSGGRYDYRAALPLAEQSSYSDGPTAIGKDCWIGAKSVILDNVSIGDHAVVGAGAVVTKDVPNQAIAMGVPAKVVDHRKIAEHTLIKQSASTP